MSLDKAKVYVVFALVEYSSNEHYSDTDFEVLKIFQTEEEAYQFKLKNRDNYVSVGIRKKRIEPIKRSS